MRRNRHKGKRHVNNCTDYITDHMRRWMVYIFQGSREPYILHDPKKLHSP